MTTEEPTQIVLQRRTIFTDSGSYVEYRFSDRPEEVFTDVEELCRSRGFDPVIHHLEPNTPMPKDQIELAIAETKQFRTIAETKQFRKDLDEVLQRLKHASDPTAPHTGARSSRERDLAITKIQEAIMWLGMDLKAINEESPGASPSPYPQSYNPESPVIEPTADGLKL